ncbi:MAG: ArsB/NhaD family transporter [Candidatus Thermoplasmatota archaeon]|nr:ArsB/NhaD family transporter [Candidatus Thermoplasmatota archaeon]
MNLSIQILVPLVIFAITYIGIISNRIDRTVAVMVGALSMILVGHALGFYDQNLALGYIDFNTIGLLMGMMMLVGMLGDSGFFGYLAIKTAKMSNGSYYRLLTLFILVTGFASAFLDNITTILLMVPVTITIAEELEVTPVPFVIGEGIAAHIGGTATLIGDPPNILIGSQAGINFVQFMIYLGPIVLIVLFSTLLVFELMFHDIMKKDMTNFDKIVDMDESEKIKDWDMFKKAIISLLFTMCLFTVHHILGIDPWVVAMLGASVLLLLSFSDPKKAIAHVHWSTLLFLVGLFILIGGLDNAGIIDLIAIGVARASGGSLLKALFMVMIVSGTFSIVVGNIPATITLIPAIGTFIELSGLGTGYAVNPMWWALSLAVCLGSNGTLISGPANLMVANISEGMGYKISFRDFTKISLPVTIFSLVLSFLLLWFFFIVLM